jgi:hypothetical protein
MPDLIRVDSEVFVGVIPDVDASHSRPECGRVRFIDSAGALGDDQRSAWRDGRQPVPPRLDARIGEDKMVNASQVMEEDKSVLRWSGLASVGGGLLFILIFAMVLVFAGADPAEPAGPIMRFPDIRVVRTVENSLYLAVLVLWVPLSLALYRRLRRTRPAPALFGSALSLLGIGVLAAGALPHVATARLSNLYHASGATPNDQATLVLVWQATQGIFDALLLVGLLVMTIGIIVLGVAMHGDPAFGKGVGRVSVVLGIVGLAAGAVVLVDPLSLTAAVGVFALIVFHLVLGWKVYGLSRAA